MKAYLKKKQSEFRWLTPEETLKYKYTYVCYQEPYSDEPNSVRDPLSVPRFISIDGEGNLSKLRKYYPLEYIDDWRTRCGNINVYKSFGLLSSEHGNDIFLAHSLLTLIGKLGDLPRDVSRIWTKHLKTYVFWPINIYIDSRKMIFEHFLLDIRVLTLKCSPAQSHARTDREKLVDAVELEVHK